MVHPIVAQMEPSPEQAPAITWREGDLLVTAGAGSGKTRTLVARYLALLAEGLPLRSVVAVTFTRKAAREMRNRVRLQVQRYVGRADLAEGEWQRWLDIYGALDAARIGTIHSLCSELLRAHPAEAGVDPRFEVLDEAQTSLLRRQAAEEGLAWAANAPEVSGLYDLWGEGELRDMAQRMLEMRLDVEPVFASEVVPWTDWQATLVPPLAGFADNPEAQAAFGELAALEGSDALARAEAAGDDLVPVVRDLCVAWDMLWLARRAGDWETASGWLSSLDGLLRQKGKKGNWTPANPKETIKGLRQLYEQVPSWLRKGDLTLDRRLAEATPALSKLHASVAGAYQRLRDERNALDFDDLEQRAVALLRDDPQALARWQQDVQAILVDEFQDTNRRQLALVDLLNGGRGRATFVGDDKQSIYRFRGADVSLFRELRRRCTEQDGAKGSRTTALGLDLSYRAHRDLLAGLNALLRPALAEQAEGDLRAYRREPSPGWAPPYIELHLTVGTKGEGRALERAASALAARLRELAASGRTVQEGKEVRPLGYGDMAILCRASRSFSAYEDALDDAGIPFTTVAGRGFYQRPEVRDLLNALRALSEPRDDLAVAGLLRSPALGLSDATLYALCRYREQNGICLWQALQDSLSSMHGVQGDLAGRALDLMVALHEQEGRVPVAELLKAFVDETHYRAALEQAGQGRAVRNVDKLLADAHASGIVSAGEFLEYVTHLRDAGTREGEARATSEGAVQIMTVHAAKGLEFPVVVLGDIGAERGSHAKLLVDPALGVLLPLRGQDDGVDPGEEGDVEARQAREAAASTSETPRAQRLPPGRGKWPATWMLATERETQAEHEESARLLYVAATRAREMLLISGCMRLNKANRPTGLGEWLAWLAEPLGLCEREIAHEETGQGIARMVLQSGDTPVLCLIYEPGCSWEATGGARREVEMTSVGAVPLLAPLARHREPESKATGTRELGPRVWQVMPVRGRVHAPQWVVGQVVHQALASWRFPDSGFERWAEAQARTLGLVDPRMLRDAAARSAVLLGRFKRHPLYEEMSAAQERRAEIPYSRFDEDGRVDNGIIDALYRWAGQWTIVEFKTDHVRNAEDEKRIVIEHQYVEQARRYARAVEAWTGERPRHIFCWLDYQGTVVCDSRLPPV